MVQGPPVTAESLSGSRIEVLEGLPTRRKDCHFDRDYSFTSLGDFADLEGIRYVKTSNDDRKTPADHVMWRLDIRVPATVFINFRSLNHLNNSGALAWLQAGEWNLKPDFKSTVSSGVPNG